VNALAAAREVCDLVSNALRVDVVAELVRAAVAELAVPRSATAAG
jgi:hypothetical protein